MLPDGNDPTGNGDIIILYIPCLLCPELSSENIFTTSESTSTMNNQKWLLLVNDEKGSGGRRIVVGQQYHLGPLKYKQTRHMSTFIFQQGERVL